MKYSMILLTLYEMKYKTKQKWRALILKSPSAFPISPLARGNKIVDGREERKKEREKDKKKEGKKKRKVTFHLEYHYYVQQCATHIFPMNL